MLGCCRLPIAYCCWPTDWCQSCRQSPQVVLPCLARVVFLWVRRALLWCVLPIPLCSCCFLHQRHHRHEILLCSAQPFEWFHHVMEGTDCVRMRHDCHEGSVIVAGQSLFSYQCQSSCSAWQKEVFLVWRQEMEAVIRQRFGAHGLRVFRLLLLHPQLEQKQIAEKAMLPPKVSLPACTPHALL